MRPIPSRNIPVPLTGVNIWIAVAALIAALWLLLAGIGTLLAVRTLS
jgi:hypothetical protein